MSNELKTCPFCGGEAELVDFGKYDEEFRVICNGDGCINSAARVTYLQEKQAIAAWNKRVEGGKALMTIITEEKK
jgi:endogenous inhibitor of DNA gyrase (YacG/DUF329 family)